MTNVPLIVIPAAARMARTRNPDKNIDWPFRRLDFGFKRHALAPE